MLSFQGPGQLSPTLGDAINAGYGYLELNALTATRGPDRLARHRAAAGGNAGPWAGTVHALQGLLRGPGLQPSGGAMASEDFSRRPAVDVVAGRAV